MTAPDSKGEKILAALAANKNCELTTDGANYIVQRFDPYHDKPIRPVGYPDSFNGHTVSRCVKKTMTFTYQSGGAPVQTAPWDVHIFQTPIAKPVPLTMSVQRHANTFTFNPTAAATKAYGGLMAVASLTSGADIVTPVPGVGVTQVGQLYLNDSDLENCMRVTSMGFEVIDGTAELYRQGILTTYRQNQPQKEVYFMKGVSIEGAGLAYRQTLEQTGQMVAFPPANANNALLFPDAKQWKTSEGAYVDIDFNTSDIPMAPPSNVAPYVMFDTDNQSMGDDQTPLYIPQTGFNIYGFANPIPGTAGVGSEFVNAALGQRILPINQSGVILTGLNPLATITVNAIYYLECAPTSNDQELLSMATQSPALDDFALMIISKLRRDSPIAVKRRENYTGQWFFEGVKDVINKVAPWLANASYVGGQVSKWIDRAGTNDGFINPQSFVKGSVSKKIAAEKHPKKKIPNAPGPMPSRAAFRSTKAPRVAKRPSGYSPQNRIDSDRDKRIDRLDQAWAEKQRKKRKRR